ncbi:MAG: DNA cytosine methyltransferase [Alphaproteobacteria bacterium]
MAKLRKILVADLLCGAGGSSTGCAQALDALGLEMELVCLNHWPTAIETHQRNHPKARHYCQDISTVRPHLVVPEGYLDLLMASPTCTHHSVARGGKPTSDQQRSDPWHIITWFTELRVKRAIIENVWEFRDWGPVDPKTGRPIKERKGEYFRAWCDTIRGLGGEFEYRKLNAADYGEATTRSRFIMVIRFDGKPIAWPTPTHAKPLPGVLPLGLKPWRPAREIIDWSLKGKSIFDRKKPLSPKTVARIYAGAVKFNWPEPFLVILRNHMAAQSIDLPLPTIAANGGHIALAQPVVIATAHGVDAAEADPHSRRAHDPADPLGTIHAGGGNFAVAEPVIMKQNFRRDVQSVDDPVPTVMTQARIGVAEPVIMNGRKGNQAKAVSAEPVPTLDTKGGVWMAEPYILDRNGADGGAAERRAHSVSDPAPTATCRGAGYLVQPMILSQQSSSPARSVDEPVPTITTGGAGTDNHPGCGRHAVVQPFIISQASGGAPRETGEPVPTITTDGAHALIAPYYGSGSGETCHSADDPLPTATSKARFGLARPFITAAFGEAPGQAPRAHDVDAPAPTICATGHVNLVEAAEGYDILFRMLEPHELGPAMGFDDYKFAGTKTDQIKQIGNAVSVRKMKAVVSAVMEDAAKAARAAKKNRKVA